jgi:hypothetical protein
MPNPSIAKAVASYAGSMNIWETFALFGTRVSPPRLQTHEIQRPKIWERFGSAARLKAGPHPTGGRDSVVTTSEAFEVRSDTGGRRSPLLVRFTETISNWVPEAAPAPWTAAANPVTVRQPTTAIAAMFLAARRLTRSAITAVLLVSISISRLPLSRKLRWCARAAHCTMVNARGQMGGYPIRWYRAPADWHPLAARRHPVYRVALSKRLVSLSISN